VVLYLHAESPPRGRCVLLVQALYRVTGRREAIDIAMSLFGFVHRPDNPVRVDVADPAAVEALKAICVGFGIVVEARDE